jgi:hypothetical protein
MTALAGSPDIEGVRRRFDSSIGVGFATDGALDGAIEKNLRQLAAGGEGP